MRPCNGDIEVTTLKTIEAQIYDENTFNKMLEILQRISVQPKVHFFPQQNAQF